MRISSATARLLARLPERDSSFAFGARLALAAAVTFVLVAIPGYLLLEHSFAKRQISVLATVQRADIESFERISRLTKTPTRTFEEIQAMLAADSRRSGTLEARLIDPLYVVRASGDGVGVWTRDANGPVDAALLHGVSYAGHEHNPQADPNDFEFVTPVRLFGTRYAYEVTYDHRAYDAQLREVRTTLALTGLLLLLGGGVAFYLLGGRGLMRDHRAVLRRATRDGLTDLPNQRAFQDEFPQSVAAADRYQHPLALALLDVDNFKLINDRHGHPHGDVILKRVAGVLRRSRPSDRPYRIGGDEFALLLANTDLEGARTLARRLGRDFEAVGVEASIGVSVLHAGSSADGMRAEADAALYEAKRLGGNRAAHFNDIRGQVAVTTPTTIEAVRRLIDEQGVSTVFQPIWDLASGSLLGLEALSRPDPSYGLSGPAEAFDVAEQIGRSHQLDVLCVECALKAARDLDPGVLLFVNLSPITLDLDSEGDGWLHEAVLRHGLSPDRVVIEVTERFGGRTTSVVRALQALHEQGFRLAVDDVGTGNSGLEMLRAVEAEFVKIDRSVVVASATEPAARAVLMAMAAFARQTGAFVIAEGIEDEDTLEFLRSIDERDLIGDTVIQGGQGHELGRPSLDTAPHSPAALLEAPRDRGARAKPAGRPLSAAASAAPRRA